jgi:hypothetical protein
VRIYGATFQIMGINSECLRYQALSIAPIIDNIVAITTASLYQLKMPTPG